MKRQAAVLALALVALEALAVRHPGLRLVDFISFAERARRLAGGEDLLHPLYPVGYPALLLAGRVVAGDVLVAGKALAVLAGAGAVAATARLLGAGPALWLLVQGAMLEWGATEGTDMPAAALSLGCLAAAAGRRPVLAGVLAGLAVLMRYTAVAILPVALLLAGQPWRLLAAAALTTAPHWGVALALGRSPLPDQSFNLAIAAGAPTRLWSWETLARWPQGFTRAAALALAGWPTRLAALGLLVGAWQRDRRAWGLLGWAALHLALVGLAFSNPRLVLPAAMALALGAAWLLPRWWIALGVSAALALGGPRAWRVDPEERALAEIVVATEGIEGRVLTTSPWFHLRRDGWLLPGTPMRELGGDPRAITPEQLASQARARGYGLVALDSGRVQATYPGLAPLLRNPLPADFELQAKARGWRVLRLVP